MGKKYYRSMQINLCGQSCCLETWHEDRGWFHTTRYSKVTHYSTAMTWQESSKDTYAESEAKAKNAASIWLSNWLKQQQEAERQRKEAEQKRIEAVRKAEQAGYQEKLRKEQEEHARIQREKEAELQRQRAEQERQRREHQKRIQRQREEHARQLKQTQISSLTALKNEKSAERQRITTHELNPVEAKIAEIDRQILTEEKEIYKFSAERNDKTRKILILIGMTGDGKSTFGNRLCGDISFMSNDGPYKTSDDNGSCTQVLQKSVNGKLTVIDCPGYGDTNDNDRTHTNNLCAFLKGCGGINAFVVVRNGANCRFDGFFQQQLKYMASVFGDGFWKHLIVVLTHIDKGIAEFQFKNGNKAQQMKDDVAKLCDGVNKDVAVIPIGLDNYEEKLPLFMKAIPSDRFTCDHITSPIDTLKADKVQLVDQKNGIKQRVDALTNEMNDIDVQIANLNR